MNKKSYILLAILVAFSVISTGCEEKKEETKELDITQIAINGHEYSWGDMERGFTVKTVDGKTGVSLSDIVNASGIGDPFSVLFEIRSSDDGYNKTVTWGFMLRGILIKEEFTTYFPDLPGRYGIKNTGSISPDNFTKTITVNSVELTQVMPFDRWFETTELNGTEGIAFTDIINYTGPSDPENHDYRITAHDGYSKTVNWTSMSGGLYVQDGYGSFFPTLENKYNIKDIKEISIV